MLRSRKMGEQEIYDTIKFIQNNIQNVQNNVTNMYILCEPKNTPKLINDLTSEIYNNGKLNIRKFNDINKMSDNKYAELYNAFVSNNVIMRRERLNKNLMHIEMKKLQSQCSVEQKKQEELQQTINELRETVEKLRQELHEKDNKIRVLRSKLSLVKNYYVDTRNLMKKIFSND